MDFFDIKERKVKTQGEKDKELVEVYPSFLVDNVTDMMIRGGEFYAVWDKDRSTWSTDSYELRRLVDEALLEHRVNCGKNDLLISALRTFESNQWPKFLQYSKSLSDNYRPLDERLTFANTEVKKSDYVSKRLPYSLAAGDYSAWDELVGTLYEPDERAKIEWAIGAVVSGDAKNIQKFLVFYGPAGTGKSTILNVIAGLFEGYVAHFEAKALGSNNGQFATEAFRDGALVAIQHDGDLSAIQDNTRLNSIISHEEMTMNVKYKASYTARVNAFLFMGTNQPVRISDSRSGIIRRLIDVKPSGSKIPANHYTTLLQRVHFEYGAIAQHCLDVYRQMGKNYYNGYRPTDMMFSTDPFLNFIESYHDIFKSQNGVSLRQAYTMYKEFCTESGIDRPLPRHKIREELRSYFEEFHERWRIDDQEVRSYYYGFKPPHVNNFSSEHPPEEDPYSLSLDSSVSLLDQMLGICPAQYAGPSGNPRLKWSKTTTQLKDLDTSKLHYVQLPENHIVIDFDLKDDKGEKSLDLNLEAASKWPATYAELSKSGSGVHLHYIYAGNPDELAPIFEEHIEIKVFRGDASLRRKVSLCNDIPVQRLVDGLPKRERKMIDSSTIATERGLRTMIERNLRKEIHPGTKPSIDFIHKILEDAYGQGLVFDVLDMRPKILAFAANSNNQALTSLKIVQSMKFASDEQPGQTPGGDVPKSIEEAPIVIFDVEVYPNLFIVCWKYRGSDTVVRMINPTSQDMEKLFKFRLIGFFNRMYDNHILYGCYLGMNNAQLFQLSQELTGDKRGGGFGEAYNLSYADIYDFLSEKKSLKKFEIELGVPHVEMNLPWDQPVPDDMIDKVVEYCVNDVNATEAVLDAREADFTARKMMAELSGLAVNKTTRQHTEQIVFGNERRPQSQFNYTDLSKEFPEYRFIEGKSYLGDELLNEGGLVRAEHGYHENVTVLDVASMHPSTIITLNLFGPFTAKFAELVEARIAIKRGDFDKARSMLDGKLAPYLVDETQAKQLAYALKIIINSVYGLTAAKFDTRFRDIRNVDNIVAKRGALFMATLQREVEKHGFTVAHIKTDSIKIPNATPEIIDFIAAFGKQYGYEFELEAVYNKMVLVNDAVYVARMDGPNDESSQIVDPETGATGRANDRYVAVGAQFQHPYVFKTLFSKEPITFEDMCETKSVIKGAIYLDLHFEKMAALHPGIAGMHFVGKTGLFVPVRPGVQGGGRLYRVDGDKHHNVAGTKGYLWSEAEMVRHLETEQLLDMDYYDSLAEDAISAIEKWTGYGAFVR